MNRIDLPPVWLGLFIAAAWLQSTYLPIGSLGGGARWLAWVLILAGLLLMALAISEMRRHRTTIVPGNTPSALVNTGIFRFSRNPIYLGEALILAGLCLAWEAISGLILVPAFAAVIRARFILWEENRLRDEFGDAFERYAATVRRWL